MKLPALLPICAVLAATFNLIGCSNAHVDHTPHYWDRRPQGATNGPGDRDPNTPGSGLTSGGVNTMNGEGANPIR